MLSSLFKVKFPKVLWERAIQGPEKSRKMCTYRVPKCGRHFVKFDDVTIYPVLVVAWTVLCSISVTNKTMAQCGLAFLSLKPT